MKAFYLLVVLSSLSLTACGPHYQLVDNYEPVTDPKALQCVKKCDQEHAKCTENCTTDYQVCYKNAQDKAGNALPMELDIYEREYRTYAFHLKRYHYDMEYYEDERDHLRRRILNAEQVCADNKSKTCPEADGLNYRLNSLDRPIKPFQPVKPTISSLTNQYAMQCDRRCDCPERYKHCYISCGGRVTTDKICVSNCN